MEELRDNVTPDGPARSTPAGGVRLRTALVCLLACLVIAPWIAQSEIVRSFCEISHSVPAIPGVAILFVTMLLYPLSARLGRRFSLDRRDVLLVYIFISVAAVLPGFAAMGLMLDSLGVPFYLDTAENRFAEFNDYVPRWLVPHDKEVVRQFFEGNPTGAVPWPAWLAPILGWLVLYGALWAAMTGLMVIVRRQWQERERLVYPLTYLPLELTEGMGGRRTVVPFLRDPLMWVGFGIAFLYDLTNMLHAYNPSVPAVGTVTSIAGFFTERPWSAFIQYNQIFHHPEVIGFGYLMNTEMAFSIWVLYLTERLAVVASTAVGHEVSHGLRDSEQAGGAYVAMALLLLWGSREHLGQVLRKAADPGCAVDDSTEPLSYRAAVATVVGGFVALIIWAGIAGMAPWLAIVFFALLLGTVVVYARVRAEIGVPVVFGFPATQAHEAIKYVLGPAALVRHGGWRNATIFQTVYFIAYSPFLSLGANQAEGLRIASAAGIRARSVIWTLAIAMLAGYLLGYWTRLGVYYEYGSGGANSVIGWGSAHGKGMREELVGWTTTFPPPDRARIMAAGVGFTIATALAAMRMLWLRFPLHPLGYCLACTDGINLWNHMLIVWVVKVLVLKLGGMRTYRRLIPCFLGIAVGRFIAAGVLNNLVGLIGGEAFQRYGVWFN